MLEWSNARRSSWRSWAAWGIAAVVVVTAGPLIVDQINVKGNATPVALTGDASGSRQQPTSGVLGTLYAVSEPAGAGVLMDGRFVGVTPLRFQWGAGPVTLTLKKNGFQDLIAPVEVMVSKEVDLRVSLQPETMPVAGGKTEQPREIADATSAREVILREAGDGVGDGNLRLANVIKHPPENKSSGPNKSAEKSGEKTDSKRAGSEKVTSGKDGAEKVASGKDGAEKVASAKAGAEQTDSQKSEGVEKSKEDKGKTGKNKRTRKPEVPTEADMAGITTQDVRESAKNPELASLLRGNDAASAENLNFSYAIQLAAFVDRDSAIRNAALWRKRGYDAYVLELWGVKDPSKKWQSVRIGRFNDLALARQALEAFKRQEKDNLTHKEFYVARSDAFSGPEVASVSQSAKVNRKSQPASEATAASWGEAGKSGSEKNDAAKEASNPGSEQSRNVPHEGMPPKSESKVESAPAEQKPLASLSPEPRKEEAKVGPVDVARAEPSVSAAVENKDGPANKAVESNRTKKKGTENPPVAHGEKSLEKVAWKEESPTGANIPDGGRSPLSSVRGTSSGSSSVKLAEVDSGGAPRGQPDAVTREVVASMAGGSEPDKDHLLNARKEVALRSPEPVMTKTAKDVDADSSRSGAGQKSETRKATDKRKGEAASKNDGARIAADLSAWVERTFQQSVVKKEAGDREGEEGLLNQVIKADPGHKAAVRRLARIMVESNRADKALDLLRQAAGGRGDTSLADEDPNLAAFLAALYQRREEHWQAIDLYEALLKKYPNKGLWQMGMAISLEKVDENAEAMRAYKKALASGDLNLKLQNFVRKRIEKL
ncbi:MAG: PEGA domain-containing protein [Magnetococcales bacterium]|nr:PEGA domain-containing protein [Magnetococcales bacterium]